VRTVVLVVDEDESYAPIRRVCDAAGFVVLHAQDAADATVHLQHDSPAVLVMPRRLPDRDALVWLAQLRHSIRNVLIVVGDPGDPVVRAGADLVLGHPLDERALANALQPLRSTRRLELLIVEPDPHLSVVMQRWLAIELDASVVTTGHRAIEELRKRKHDAVLAEFRLPDMDAAELHAAIETASPGLGARTLFMIGGFVANRSQQFLERIPGQWIHKPFDLARLRAVLDALLE